MYCVFMPDGYEQIHSAYSLSCTGFKTAGLSVDMQLRKDMIVSIKRGVQ